MSLVLAPSFRQLSQDIPTILGLGLTGSIDFPLRAGRSIRCGIHRMWTGDWIGCLELSNAKRQLERIVLRRLPGLKRLARRDVLKPFQTLLVCRT
jgi:hypothetical protein